MAYIITKTNGDALVTVPDTEKNTDYGVTLVGRNYSGYGVFLNDNFVALMENFASTNAPITPLDGQLWFSTTTKNLSLWEGSAWKVISSITSSESEPGSAGRKIGDFWFDNNTYQLKIWTGETVFQRNVTANSTGNIATITSTTSLLTDDVVTHANISLLNDVRISQVLNPTQIRLSANANLTLNDAINFTRGSGWYTVGPAYTRGQKVNGIIPSTITDTNATSHTVGLIYVDGSIVGTASNDLEYTPAIGSAIPGFSTIKPGLQLRSSSSTQIVKTVQTYSVGSAGETLIQLVSNQDLLVGDRYTSANVSIGAGAIVSALYPNNAVTVNTTTTVYVNEDVTFQRGSTTVALYNGTATNAQKLANKSADLYAQLDSYSRFLNNVDVEGNLAVGGNIQLLQNLGNLTIRNIVSGANISFVSNVPLVGSTTTVLNIDGSDGLLTVRADPTANLGVSTKQYVDSTKDTLVGFIASNVAALINSAPVSRQDFGNVSNIIDDVYSNLATLTTTVGLRATINNPAFTGAPTAPTPDSSTDTTQIATTAFVQNLIASTNNAWQANAASQQLALALKSNTNDPAFTGIPTAPTASAGTSTTQIATTAFVTGAINTLSADVSSSLLLKADLSSPALTGTPTAPTASAGTSTTQIATTAFVVGENNSLNASLVANLSAANTQIALRASIASPTFTGTPVVPNAAPGTNSGQIASTAWVNGTIANINLATYAQLSSPTFTNVPAAPTANISANTTQLATTAFVHRLLPAGMIIMWSGSAATVPFGWQICDGTNSTPDLRNRFIVGAGSTYNPGATGGATANTATTASNGSHTHSGATGSTALTIDQMPSHTHSGSATVLTNTGSGFAVHKSSQSTGTTTLTVANTGGSQGHTHTIGSDGAHNHSVVVSTVPPYYALCYIMKVI